MRRRAADDWVGGVACRGVAACEPVPVQAGHGGPVSRGGVAGSGAVPQARGTWRGYPAPGWVARFCCAGPRLCRAGQRRLSHRLGVAWQPGRMRVLL